MELLYNNKVIISFLVGLLISAVYYNYNKINELVDDKNTSTSNKDKSLYIFIIITCIIYGILYFTHEKTDNVLQEIHIGEPPF